MLPYNIGFWKDIYPSKRKCTTATMCGLLCTSPSATPRYQPVMPRACDGGRNTLLYSAVLASLGFKKCSARNSMQSSPFLHISWRWLDRSSYAHLNDPRNAYRYASWKLGRTSCPAMPPNLVDSLHPRSPNDVFDGAASINPRRRYILPAPRLRRLRSASCSAEHANQTCTYTCWDS